MPELITLPMKLAVEFFGTLFFLSVIIVTGNWAAIGAALALVAFLGGGISGGHYNPAVTFMMLLKGSIEPIESGLYVVAQVAGAAIAYMAYNALVLVPITSRNLI
jgi:aquaporin Z